MGRNSSTLSPGLNSRLLAFVTPVEEHWLEQEIAQWVHPMKDRSNDPSHHQGRKYLFCNEPCLMGRNSSTLSPGLNSRLLAFVTPVEEHWLEQEIAQWVHPMKDRSNDPSHHQGRKYLFCNEPRLMGRNSSTLSPGLNSRLLAFVTPVEEHWLEQEIAQWVHPMKDRSNDPSHHQGRKYLFCNEPRLMGRNSSTLSPGLNSRLLAFVTPVEEHWLEQEIAQWVHPMKDRSNDPSHHQGRKYLFCNEPRLMGRNSSTLSPGLNSRLLAVFRQTLILFCSEHNSHAS